MTAMGRRKERPERRNSILLVADVATRHGLPMKLVVSK
jgi:hypothetical protein